DIKLVKKLIKRIGAEMLEDPMYKDGFIQPLKSQGVRRMEEFNMVVGVKFMAKPGEQWVIRRDAYQKIVNAFEANGIRLAERNVKVQVVSDRPLTDDEQEAVVGAAQEAIEQKEASGPPPDEP
ncbi:MAG: mechanosensitive ion channel family protein, partial [Rhizobiaceae bacterium]|nr:mechanosensitive ion channel family protein [Rhizobiaceae bacterium]